ncbi:hypothetical protein SNEBB_010496 [Seison nebaliae]|nr:hypothetical protein SNEBB_010496 [Seison nebaliae]
MLKNNDSSTNSLIQLVTNYSDAIEDEDEDDFSYDHENRISLEVDEDVENGKCPKKLTEVNKKNIMNFPDYGVKMPPKPYGRASTELQKKFKKTNQLTNNTINEQIESCIDYRNPSIYEHLINHVKIEENDSNFPPTFYSPTKWPDSSYYNQLSDTQQKFNKAALTHSKK